MSVTQTYRDAVIGSPIPPPMMLSDVVAPIDEPTAPADEFPPLLLTQSVAASERTPEKSSNDDFSRANTRLPKPHYPSSYWEHLAKWMEEKGATDKSGWYDNHSDVEEGEIRSTTSSDMPNLIWKAGLNMPPFDTTGSSVIRSEVEWLPPTPTMSPYPWSDISIIPTPRTPPPSPQIPVIELPSCSNDFDRETKRINRPKGKGKGRISRPGNAIQRAAVRDQVPRALIPLTPLPGRPSPLRISLHTRRMQKMDGMWKRRGERDQSLVPENNASNQQTCDDDIPSIQSPYRSKSDPIRITKPLSKPTPKQFKAAQLNDIIASIKQMKDDLNRLPDAIQIKEARITAARALENVDKLTRIVANREEIANRPTFRYVNQITSELQERVNTLEDRSDAPLHERESGILGFAVAQMKRGDEIIDSIVGESQRKGDELRAEMEKVEHRSAEAERSLATLKEDFERMTYDTRALPKILAWSEYQSDLSGDKVRALQPDTSLVDFAHTPLIFDGPEVCDPILLQHHTFLYIANLTALCTAFGHGVPSPQSLGLLLSRENRLAITTPLQAVALYIEAVSLCLDHAQNYARNRHSEREAAILALRLYEVLYPTARRHIIALALERGDLVHGSTKRKDATSYLFDRLSDIVETAEVPFLEVDDGENFAGRQGGRWLPFVGRHTWDFFNQMPLVSGITTTGSIALSHYTYYYTTQRLHRYLRKTYLDTIVFKAPLFETTPSSAHVTSSGALNISPSPTPLFMKTPYAVFTILVGWITRSLWDINRAHTSTPLPAICEETDFVLSVCMMICGDISDFFHTMIVNDASARVDREITELGSSCTAFYLALIHLNSRLIPRNRYIIHRGESHSASDMPGTQIPWIARPHPAHPSLLPTPSPSLPPSPSYYDDREMRDVDEIDDDLYSKVKREESVDNLVIRPFAMESSPSL